MALDGVNHVLYWIDAVGYEVGRDGRICCVNLQDGSKKVLVRKLDQPRCLCLAPGHGKMFWLAGDERSTNGMSLYQADLDGSNPRPMVNSIRLQYASIGS